MTTHLTAHLPIAVIQAHEVACGGKHTPDLRLNTRDNENRSQTLTHLAYLIGGGIHILPLEPSTTLGTERCFVSATRDRRFSRLVCHGCMTNVSSTFSITDRCTCFHLMHVPTNVSTMVAICSRRRDCNALKNNTGANGSNKNSTQHMLAVFSAHVFISESRCVGCKSPSLPSLFNCSISSFLMLCSTPQKISKAPLYLILCLHLTWPGGQTPRCICGVARVLCFWDGKVRQDCGLKRMSKWMYKNSKDG